MGLDTGGYERINMSRQVADDARPTPPGELTEREPDGHPAPDALRAVPLARHPRDVRLDLRRDPRPPKPINRRRLQEILLQHGQPPICT
jgi:hypothetical protein